jgi:YidC/Oxa1 family membrane protein insertase
MSALYRQEGTSMFASITPLLFQWPFLSVMYLLFRSPLIAGKPNTLLAHDLLGVPLGGHWLSAAGPASLHGVVFLGLFALLAGLCWLSSRLGQLMAAPAGTDPAPAPGGSGVLVKALPYLTVVIAAFTPLAAGIYLLTSTGWSRSSGGSSSGGRPGHDATRVRSSRTGGEPWASIRSWIWSSG